MLGAVQLGVGVGIGVSGPFAAVENTIDAGTWPPGPPWPPGVPPAGVPE
jgi:hypothetical protein